MGKKKCRNLENIQPVLKRALKEYEPNILEDDEKMYRIKQVVDNLQEVDRIIFLLYTELHSFTALSAILGISRSSCFWTVKRIREEIKEKLQRSNT